MPDLLAVFHVSGRPRTKGSLKPIVDWARRKVRLIEDHPHSKPWRIKMVRAIRQAHPHLSLADHVPYAGAVEVRATFLFERKGPTALRLAYPMVNGGANANGDLDKLERNLLDALKDACVLADDSVVCGLVTGKRWAVAPAVPGLDVVVYALDD